MTKFLSNNNFDGYFPTWCPGCGNFGIWAAIKTALNKLKIQNDNVAVVYGVGCSGNMNDFLWVNSIHSLHGRAVPTAIGIKIANHKLPVLAVVGDGDCYGEGGNHLIHAARGNNDITVIVHDNRVYGLTTGQVAPTAFQGAKSKSTPGGIIEISLNPLSLALTQGATHVVQGFAGDVGYLADLIAGAIEHRGFSLVNVLQPCVTFNKANDYTWYRQRIYKLDATNHNASSMKEALEKAVEINSKIPIGVIYQEIRPTYTDCLPQLKNGVLAQVSLETELDKYTSEFV